MSAVNIIYFLCLLVNLKIQVSVEEHIDITVEQLNSDSKKISVQPKHGDRRESQLVAPTPKDCSDLLKMGQRYSEKYFIYPDNIKIRVYCDMTTDEGGWTMAKLTWLISLSILVVFLISENEATAPLFLQAITSALATIPFTGGPMTTGLVGAKLAIGTKLLYYLGFFGRRSKPVPAPVAKTTSTAGFTGGLQAVPLPYYLSGAGRFPQMGNNFGAQGGFYGQSSFDGIDPAQLFQALRAQGFDPNTAMQMINYGGFEVGGGFANMPQGGGFANMPQGGGFANMPQGGGFAKIPQEFPQEDSVEEIVEPQNPSEGASDDIESFFTFLKDMDENLCISRLVCDIGNDPSFLGDFSENIHSIVKSLDVAPTSGAYPYVDIMETGRNEGGCAGRFPQCSDSAYEVVKSVAPSVGVPSNINPEAVDQL